MTARALEAVFFDVGNTLIHPSPGVPEVCGAVLEEAGYAVDVSVIEGFMPLVDAYYEERYAEDDGFWADEERTASVWLEMYTLLCRRVGLDGDAPMLARRVYDEFGRPERWALYEDVRPAFERLRSLGIRVGIISNWDSRLPALLRGLGLEGVLSDIVASAEVGLHKPDPRIFELACERMGVSPEHAAHVGDHHYADYLGASALGMKAVLIDRFGEGGHNGVRPIRTLDVLERALEM